MQEGNIYVACIKFILLAVVVVVVVVVVAVVVWLVAVHASLLHI